MPASRSSLSIFWCIFAVALVAGGFLRRVAAARYAGLALLAVTVVKVLFVDLSQVQQGLRVASFVISGLLLIGTSVLYSRLAPRLLEPEKGSSD